MVAWAPLIIAGASIASNLFGKKKAKKRSTLDKYQKQLYKQQNEGLNGEGPLAGLYNFNADKARENYMQNIGKPAYQKFNEEVVPGITGAFRQKGLGNSTYAGQALAREGRNVQNNLNAGMNDYLFRQEESVNNRKQNAINSSLNLNTQAIERPQANPLDSILHGAGGEAGKYLFNSFKDVFGGAA
jgi:hypothetical protein